MPPTLQHELRAVDSIEAVWCVWISQLTPWQRRFVFAHELEFHDLFCSGEWSWTDLEDAIRRHFAS
jgi:hypothetical protein